MGPAEGASDDNKYSLINFEETELRLGLPGAGGNGSNDVVMMRDQEALKNNNGKRGFSEATTGVDLKLNLSSKDKDSAANSDNVHHAVVKPQTNQASSSTNDVHVAVKQPPSK